MATRSSISCLENPHGQRSLESQHTNSFSKGFCLFVCFYSLGIILDLKKYSKKAASLLSQGYVYMTPEQEMQNQPIKP